MLPDVAIYRQTGDFQEWTGDKILEKIAGDFFLKCGDFRNWSILAIFRRFLDKNWLYEAILDFGK